MSRIPNSGGKVLLQNWFEERATKELDATVDEIHKRGHPSLLTRSTEVVDETTHNLVYTTPRFTPEPNAPITNLRYREALKQAIAEVEADEAAKVETFTPRENPKIPKMPTSDPIHAPTWIQERPISTWTDLHSKKRVDGISAGSGFKRSAQFSTPIQQQMDEQTDVPFQLKL